MNNFIFFLALTIFSFSCKKNTTAITPPPANPPEFKLADLKINGISNGLTYYAVNTSPEIKLSFSTPEDRSTVTNNISLKTNAGAAVALIASYENDSTIIFKPSSPLSFITKYSFIVGAGLKSKQGVSLQSAVNATLISQIDSTDKFPRIPDSALLTLVQQQTFKYFWDFEDPVSGLAREGSNGPAEMVTTGGSGFGIMGMVVAVNRGFITLHAVMLLHG